MHTRQRTLALLLATVWSPAALAFPPCPIQPMDILPLDEAPESVAASTAPSWFVSYYALVGDPAYLEWIKPWSRKDGTELNAPEEPKDGKCRPYEILPVLNAYSAGSDLNANPSYSPYGGFGVIALPDLRHVPEENLAVQYTLNFEVDNRKLPHIGGWMDIVQLEFSHGTQSDTESMTTTLYRVRKSDNKPLYPATLEVIETQQMTLPGMKPRFPAVVIATLPLDPSVSDTTQIQLRWTQNMNGRYELGKDYTANRIDSLFEVLGPNGVVLYKKELPEEWANRLSMGLLNYNVDTLLPLTDALLIDRMKLSAVEVDHSGISIIPVGP